jgi:hypothetical protein
MIQEAADGAFKDQKGGGKPDSQQSQRSHEPYPAMEDENEFADIHIEIDCLNAILFHNF